MILATSGVGPVATAVIFALMVGVVVATSVFWIVRVVEVLRIPADRYRAGGSEKAIWIFFVVFGGFVGALVWHLSRRHRLLTPAG